MGDDTLVISVDVRAVLDAARRATLATIAPDGHPRLVPVCFVVLGQAIWTPLDDKPKRIDDPVRLARVRDIADRPTVAVLVDRWDEDWTRLAWVRIDGEAALREPGDPAGEHAAAVAALREKHPQYREHAIDRRPLIRIAVTRITTWGDLVRRRRPPPRTRAASP